MALGTHFYMKLITAICGTGCKGVTATADDLNLVILGMNTSLHWADLSYCVSVAYLHIGGYSRSNRYNARADTPKIDGDNRLRMPTAPFTNVALSFSAI